MTLASALPGLKWKYGGEMSTTPIEITLEEAIHNRENVLAFPAYLETAYRIVEFDMRDGIGVGSYTIPSLTNAKELGINIHGEETQSSDYAFSITSSFFESGAPGNLIGEVSYSLPEMMRGKVPTYRVMFAPPNNMHGEFGEGFSIFFKETKNAENEAKLHDFMFDSLLETIKKGFVNPVYGDYLPWMPKATAIDIDGKNILFVVSPSSDYSAAESPFAMRLPLSLDEINSQINMLLLTHISPTLALRKESSRYFIPVSEKAVAERGAQQIFESSFIRGSYNDGRYHPKRAEDQGLRLFDLDDMHVAEAYGRFVSELSPLLGVLDSSAKTLCFPERSMINTDLMGFPFDFESEKTYIGPLALEAGFYIANLKMYTDQSQSWILSSFHDSLEYIMKSKNSSDIKVNGEGMLTVYGPGNSFKDTFNGEFDFAIAPGIILGHLSEMANCYANMQRGHRADETAQRFGVPDYMFHRDQAIGLMRSYDTRHGTKLEERFADLIASSSGTACLQGQIPARAETLS